MECIPSVQLIYFLDITSIVLTLRNFGFTFEKKSAEPETQLKLNTVVLAFDTQNKFICGLVVRPVLC